MTVQLFLCFFILYLLVSNISGKLTDRGFSFSPTFEWQPFNPEQRVYDVYIPANNNVYQSIVPASPSHPLSVYCDNFANLTLNNESLITSVRSSPTHNWDDKSNTNIQPIPPASIKLQFDFNPQG